MPRPSDFRLIERDVGVAQKLLGIDPAFGERNADAGGDDDFVSVEIVGAAESVENAGRQRFALFDRLDRRLENDKLVAAETAK